MRAVRRLAGTAVTVVILLAIGFALYAFVRARPQDVPWTPLDLAETPGMFTGRKLVTLRQDFTECQNLLDRAGVAYTALPPRDPSPGCGYTDGIRLTGGSTTLRYTPTGIGTSCPVAAGMAMLEWNVIQPAAERHFGSRVRTVEHFGSYNCRRLYGRSTGSFSEHATANALDIAGFVLEDGTRITLVRDWNGQPARAAFLRDVRDGACGLFSTVLSPDYNSAHADHFHLDQADRGMAGGRACR